jgi:hypothetical protein
MLETDGAGMHSERDRKLKNGQTAAAESSPAYGLSRNDACLRRPNWAFDPMQAGLIWRGILTSELPKRNEAAGAANASAFLVAYPV